MTTSKLNVIQTACASCGADVEGVAPFTVNGDWRDRGGNRRGSDGHQHTVAAAEIRRQKACHRDDEEQSGALYLIYKAYQLAPQSTPANLRRAIEQAYRLGLLSK
jgi:hypothetical protein